MSELPLICYEFFKAGLFAIGGGLATIPFLMQMPQRYPHWFALADLADMIAVSESTPGPLGVNMSTYVGYTVAGLPGALLATLSLVLPSFVIMLLLLRVLQKFRSNRFVDAGFNGLRPAVTGLIGAAGFTVLRLAVYSDRLLPAPLALFLILFACMQTKPLKSLHPTVYIVIAALAGVVFGF